MTEAFWFAIGFVSCNILFFVVIFWTDIIKKVKSLKPKRIRSWADFVFKMEICWWNIKHYVKYKVFNK